MMRLDPLTGRLRARLAAGEWEADAPKGPDRENRRERRLLCDAQEGGPRPEDGRKSDGEPCRRDG
jgi:hypothetical protein